MVTNGVFYITDLVLICNDLVLPLTIVMDDNDGNDETCDGDDN